MNHQVYIVVTILGYGLSILTIPFILMSQKRPAGTLAWLWAVILFPYIGPLAYLVFGSEQIYRRRLLRRFRSKRVRIEGDAPSISPESLLDSAELSRQLSSLNLYSASNYSEASLLLNAQEFYPALEHAIKEARETIHFEIFIWRNDAYGKRFLYLLTDAAKRGVKVCLLLDEMGSFALFKSYFAPLMDAGGEFSWFNALHPLQNRWAFSLRNHRKLQIIDNKIAFVGGMNIGKEYMGEDPRIGIWRDAQIKLTGLVVPVLARTFRDDWFFATGKNLVPPMENTDTEITLNQVVHVIEEGPDSTNYPLVLSILTLLNLARRRIWLTAGYFFPQEPLISALKLCASRGVDVRILVGIKNEHPYIVQGARCYYEELLGYGVKIYEYDRGTHHAKIVLLDENWASVGSANIDVRSMRLNFELNVVLHSPSTSKRLQQFLEHDFSQAKEIILRDFAARSSWRRTLENLCRLVGPLV